MKQIFIRGKRTSLERARRIAKRAYGSNNFKARYKRGEVQLYFPNYISAKEVEIDANIALNKIIFAGFGLI